MTARFQIWAFPASLAVTRGILVSFFFLRLLICLSSAGNPTWFEVKLVIAHSWKQQQHNTKALIVITPVVVFAQTPLICFRGADSSWKPALPPFPSHIQKINLEQLRSFKWHSNRHAPRNTKERKMRSKIRWFTEFCNSHYLSHFAAFFIDARAKRSVAESCMYYSPDSKAFYITFRDCESIDQGK